MLVPVAVGFAIGASTSFIGQGIDNLVGVAGSYTESFARNIKVFREFRNWMVMRMKHRKIIFLMASLIIFSVLSVLSFLWANGDYSGDFIFIYCLASFLFLISLAGMIFPKKIYNLFKRIGNKVLSSSVYYDDMIVGATQGYKSFKTINIVIALISNILAVVLLVVVLV